MLLQKRWQLRPPFWSVTIDWPEVNGLLAPLDDWPAETLPAIPTRSAGVWSALFHLLSSSSMSGFGSPASSRRYRRRRLRLGTDESSSSGLLKYR